jgi:coenzyme F420-dependent glucose-6-phosphate dehydrogenase
VWCAFGTGQFLNEHITGQGWPSKSERQARLEEAVGVIRALWAGETVTHSGSFAVDEAKLYTRPVQPPLIIGAALTNESAAWVGSWADGIITAAKPPEEQQQFIECFRNSGGAGKPMYLQALHGYAKDEHEARQAAWENWRTNVFGSQMQADLKMPVHFDAAARFVDPDDMDVCVRISANIEQHIEWLHTDFELGFERIYVHNAGQAQQEFLETFGEYIVPAFQDTEKLKE